MSKNFDLKDRTKKFGIEIIIFCQKIPKNTINLPLISQLIDQEPVSVPIILKPIMPKVKMILNTKLEFQKKNQTKLSTG